ncbi:MAG: type II secretion system protein, partial [Planctomycetota bacterium]
MSRPRAFTLIELLVVVSIMALLIGLLLPVLGSARAAGRGSVCLSNIRQLVIANTAYATDHDDRFVPGAADFMSNLDRWHGGRDNFSQPFDPRRGPLWDYLRPAETRACPEFVAERDFTAGFEAGNGGYGYNLDYVGRDTLDAVEALTTRLGAQAHWFANPTETIVFADAAFA